MRPLVRQFGVVVLGATLSACASQSGTGTGGRPSADVSVITRAEMEKARYASLFEVVQALRARWLQPRGPNSFVSRPTEVQVLVDDMRMGGIETLRAMTTANVVSIVFVDPVTAAHRWGGKHVQGAIVVTTHADGVP